MTQAQNNTVAERIATARHFLFVPGNRPDRFAKAAASGADMLILDLEDAVPPGDKAEARRAVSQWLDSGGQAMVRINESTMPHFQDDLALTSHPNLLGIMLPKAVAGETLSRLGTRISILALVETAAGITGMESIARSEGVVRLALGTIDLALDLDMPADDKAFDPIRLQMTIVSRAAGLAAPVDGVTLQFLDNDVNEAAMRHARSLGFRAKLCIHPHQIAPIEAALRPTASEIERAQKIVEADMASGGAAVALDGAMVDRPVVQSAYRLLMNAQR